MSNTKTKKSKVQESPITLSWEQANALNALLRVLPLFEMESKMGRMYGTEAAMRQLQVIVPLTHQIIRHCGG